MSKRLRHETIIDVIVNNDISGQELLLNVLLSRGFDVTQATLSRDIKELKIVKAPTSRGVYTYQLSENTPASSLTEQMMSMSSIGFVSIEFSGQLAVIKTRPGYAMAIAGEIDNKAKETILGTVAGDDTILLIPKENTSRQEVVKSLEALITDIQ